VPGEVEEGVCGTQSATVQETVEESREGVNGTGEE
jgi:hypothetical protein